MAARLRHQRSSRDCGREAELQDVIVDLHTRLKKLGRIAMPDAYEEELGAIEAVAAPYAIALLYEVRRLERLFRGCQQRAVRSVRRSTFATARRQQTRRGLCGGGGDA